MTGIGHLQADALALLRRSRAVLLDFDGPVCAVFAGVGATNVADHLRTVLRAHDWPTGPSDLGPHDVLAYAATIGSATAQAVERALTEAELDAIATAEPTEGANWFLAACSDVRRPVAIVSNNSARAIEAYLERREMAWAVTHVIGRDSNDPGRMKPDPWTLSRALEVLDVPATDGVFIGDAVTDVEAASALDMPSIGYANKPAKKSALRDAGADAIVTSMLHLGDVMAAVGKLR